MLRKYITSLLIITCLLVIIKNLELISLDSITAINTSFLIGIVLMVIGASIYVSSTEFFTLFFKGFSDLKLFRQSQALKRENKMIQENTSVMNWKKQFLRSCIGLSLGSGTAFIVFSSFLATLS